MALRPVTPIAQYDRLSRDVADPSIINPLAANALEQGEWLVETTTGWARISGTNPTTGGAGRAEIVWSKRGEGPTQALNKVACLSAHEGILETDIFDDALTPAIGQLLTVHAVTVGGVANRSALTLAATGEPVRGQVQGPLPADNGGFLRIKKVSPYPAP
jgi:hypothetical protein